MFSPLTLQLIETLRALPGIGPKSAQRLAFHLLSSVGQQKGLKLADALQQAINNVAECQLCHIYTEQPYCNICANVKRNDGLLCIVESPADVVAIEQTNTYNGRYYVLHGHLSPLDGIGPEELKIPSLLERLQTQAVTEVIIATNPTMEGKATAHYLASHIQELGIQCSRIAHGVPMGGEIEYLDGSTLMHALQARMPV
jgi:recombination protein RecR